MLAPCLGRLSNDGLQVAQYDSQNRIAGIKFVLDNLANLIDAAAVTS